MDGLTIHYPFWLITFYYDSSKLTWLKKGYNFCKASEALTLSVLQSNNIREYFKNS